MNPKVVVSPGSSVAVTSLLAYTLLSSMSVIVQIPFRLSGVALVGFLIETEAFTSSPWR